MYQHSSISRSQLYQGFQLLDENAYRALVHYYEKNESDIHQLESQEFLDMIMAYAYALQQCEEFGKHLEVSDEIITFSISENIITHQDDDILQTMLYQKAYTYYKIKKFDRAVFYLSESLKINPYNDRTFGFLKKNLWAHTPTFLQRAKAFMVITSLTFVLATIVEFVAIRTLFDAYTPWVKTFRNTTLASAIILLCVAYSIHYYQTRRKSRSILHSAKEHFLYD